MPRVQRKVEIAKRTRNPAISESETIPEVIGCPVLDPILCQCPKDPVDPSDGVKMTCTWESCPYSHQLLHSGCYKLLEDNLVKRLATLGSARGWTVPQRRNNLWERKGQALIGKFCRCRCDRGQMTRDKQALYEKEKAVEKEKKKKAKKAKQLPTLQFNSKPSAAIEDKKRLVDADGFVPSPNSTHVNRTFSTTSRSRLVTDRSVSSMHTFTALRTWSQSSFAAETTGFCDHHDDTHPSDFEDLVYHADEEIDDVRVPLSPIIVPAPPPPPQSKSYAATIKSEETPGTKTPHSPDSGLEGRTPRSSFSSLSEAGFHQGDSKTYLIPKVSDDINPLGLSILSPAVSPSHDHLEFGEPFAQITSTPRNLNKKKETIRFGPVSSVSVSKLPLASPSEPLVEESRCGFSFKAPVREMMDIWQATSVPTVKDKNENGKMYDWTPLFGTGFNIGERLLYFP